MALVALWPEAFALALLISAVLALLGGFKSDESGCLAGCLRRFWCFLIAGGDVPPVVVHPA
jgi:hypothetical protein